MKLVIGMLMLVSTSCVGPLNEPSMPSISYEKKSWGRFVDGWTIQPDGWVSYRRGIAAEPPVRVRLDASMRVEVGRALRRVEVIAARPDGCQRRLTDGPYGTFAWSRGSAPNQVKWDANCLLGRNADLSRSISALDALIEKAVRPGMTTPASPAR